MESILTSIKKLLGITEDYTQFDPDVIMHINTVLMDLTELGVGPSIGFFIEDDTSVWTDFVREVGRIEAIKSYTYLRVKLLFDPPSSSALIESINRQISKFEWLINVAAEKGESEDSIRYAEYEAEITQLKVELDNETKVRKELSSRVITLTADNADLQATNDSLKTENAALEVSNSELTEQNDNLSARVEELEAAGTAEEVVTQLEAMIDESGVLL